MSEGSSHLTVQKRDSVNIVAFSDRKILEELSIREIEDELFSMVSTTPSIQLLHFRFDRSQHHHP